MRELSAETRALVRSRIENYAVLSPEAAAQAAIRIIAQDFYIYCERNLMIKDKRGQLVPLVPNWAQKKLVESVLEDLLAGRPVRYIVLKARQMGLSTIIEALCYWWTTTHRHITSVIIAHEKKAAENLYKMFRRYYENSQPQYQPRRKYNTRTDLTFDAEDPEKEEYRQKGLPSPGLSSEIKTMVAKDGGGRSDTIIFFHGSEVAFWDSSADVVSSALQAVPLLPNTFAFLESTANGVGNYFYTEWQFAKKGESVFKPFFFAWHEHPEYMIPGKVDHYDEEELELLDIFKQKGYPQEEWDAKILWRREKRKEFRTDPKKFYQEYPKDDMEAFLASGRPRFDIKQLIKMEQVAAQVAPLFGVVEQIIDPDTKAKKYELREVKPVFGDQDPTPLKVWEKPVKGVRYSIGVDVADDKKVDAGEVGDYSVIDVMDCKTLKTVARWRGHIDPDLLGDEVYRLGMYYNGALVGVEVNNHGIVVVQKLRNLFYRNLYMRETGEDEQFQERTTRMGWLTSRKTKPVMIGEMAAAMRDGLVIDYDVVFIRECMTYVVDDQGYTNAQEGMYDDCVMAKAINLQMAQWNSYDLGNVSVYKPTKKKANATSNDSFPTLADPGFRRRKVVRRRNRNSG